MQDVKILRGQTVVYGKNAVLEVLLSKRKVYKVYVCEGTLDSPNDKLFKLAQNRGAETTPINEKQMDKLCGGAKSQGVAALAEVKNFVSLGDILKVAKDKGEAPLILILDKIEDPHNLGAIIRTAECAGVHGIIIPNKNSAKISPTVEKVSAGAVSHTNIASVTNLVSAIKYLKKKNIWVFGADMEGDSAFSTDFNGPMALVVGSEGFGISRLVKENCDFLIKLPQKGLVNSLNASVATGVLLYQVLRYRDQVKLA